MSVYPCRLYSLAPIVRKAAMKHARDQVCSKQETA